MAAPQRQARAPGPPKKAARSSGKAPRRTQKERSSAMQTRLLEATLESLLAVGYAKTSTIEVAARAGVSRGAQLHHYPTKRDLVAASVGYLLEKRLEAFRAAFSKLPDGADRNVAAVDLLWEGTSSDAFYAWLELLVASRTEPALHETVVEIQKQFVVRVQATFREFFDPSGSADRPFDIAPVFSMALMQGLALERIVDREDPRIRMCLAALRALASSMLRARS
jgi:AcrR family transcriptional regulator